MNGSIILTILILLLPKLLQEFLKSKKIWLFQLIFLLKFAVQTRRVKVYSKLCSKIWRHLKFVSMEDLTEKWLANLKQIMQPGFCETFCRRLLFSILYYYFILLLLFSLLSILLFLLFLYYYYYYYYYYYCYY